MKDERPQACHLCGKPQTPDYTPMQVAGEMVTRKVLMGYSCKNPRCGVPSHDET